jgi:hypothetical protein
VLRVWDSVREVAQAHPGLMDAVRGEDIEGGGDMCMEYRATVLRIGCGDIAVRGLYQQCWLPHLSHSSVNRNNRWSCERSSGGVEAASPEEAKGEDW